MKKNIQDEHDKEDISDADIKAPDGGWGWMVVLGTSINHVVLGIIIRAYGVTYIELLRRFHSTATVTGWIGAINMTLSGIFAPVVTTMCLWSSSQTVTILGGIIMCVGVIGTAYAPNILTVFFTYGLISGIGTALVNTPGYIMVGAYFDKHKALAMAMSTFASGLGAMFPPIMLYLFEHYNFDGGLLIIAAITLNCCVGGAMYRPLKHYARNIKHACKKQKLVPNGTPLIKKKANADVTKTRSDTEVIEVSNSVESLSLLGENQTEENEKPIAVALKRPSTVTFKLSQLNLERQDSNINPTQRKRRESLFSSPDPRKKLFDASLIKEPRFVALSYGIFCTASNLGLTSAFLPILAVERGIPLDRAVFLLTIGGIGSMFGTLLTGFILDMTRIKPFRIFIYISGLLVVGLTTLINPLTDDYMFFASLHLARGICGGMLMSQRATIVSDIIIKEKLNHAVGFVLFSTSLGFLFGRGIGGLLRDATGKYDYTFYIGGSISIIGFGISLCIEVVNLYRMKKLKKSSTHC